MFYATSHV
jgi:hypothetical protein